MKLKLKKCIMYNELGKYKIEIDVILSFLEYEFCIQRDWLVRIIKTQNKTLKLTHNDIDRITVAAFVKKIYKQVDKQVEKKIEN